jgi:hypothetical protein
MKLAQLYGGLVIIACSTFGYYFSESSVNALLDMTNNYQTAILSGIKLGNQQTYLPHDGDPMAASFTKLLQVGFIIGAVIGVCCACYGIMAKKNRLVQLSNPVEKRKFQEREQEMIRLLREYIEKNEKQKQTGTMSVVPELDKQKEILAMSATVQLYKQKEPEVTPSIPESRKREILSTNLALSILKARLAKGEITQREFDRIEPFVK